MTSIAEQLREHPFFDGFDEPTLQLIAGFGNGARFAPDEKILTEAQPADRFYALRTGKVALEVDAPSRAPLIVETLGPGEILGVSWLLPPHRWTFDARAIDDTTAVAIDGARVRALCDDDPVLGYELFKRFSGVVHHRLRAARLQLLDLYGAATP